MSVQCKCGSRAINDDPYRELCDTCWRDAEIERLWSELDECRRLLKEAIAACEVYLPVAPDDETRIAVLTLEWYEAAKAAGNEQYLRYLDASEAVRKLQDKVERLKDEVRDLEDCREHLRRLGEISGCDHVESPDERAVQVSHIEQAFDRLQDEVRLLKSGTNYVCDREQRPTVVYFSNGRKVWVVDDPKGAYLDVDWQAVIKPAEGSVT